jgi:hypothetical protein
MTASSGEPGTSTARSILRRWPRSTIVHAAPSRAREEACDFLDRLLRGGEPDALKPPLAGVIQTLQREREMRPATRLDHGVDLVHDHHAGGLQHLPRTLGSEQ